MHPHTSLTIFHNFMGGFCVFQEEAKGFGQEQQQQKCLDWFGGDVSVANWECCPSHPSIGSVRPVDDDERLHCCSVSKLPNNIGSWRYSDHLLLFSSVGLLPMGW